MGRWQKIVVPKVNEQLETFDYKPTIRGMFYLLASLASDKSGKTILQNTFKEYKGFIDGMTTARKNGSIPIDAFADDTRGIYDIDDNFQTPNDYVKNRVTWLQNAHIDYFKDIPRWHGQRHYVEIWCEKAALRGLFVSIVEKEGLEVRVIVNKGWSSLSYKQNNIERLLDKARYSDTDIDGKLMRKRFHVLYFGDYDPSGRRMDLNIKLDLALANAGFTGTKLERKSAQLRSGKEKYRRELKHWIAKADELELFKRVALTRPQIQEYGLRGLENPDPKVMVKLKRDSNREAFVRENGSLFQIEVDAFQKELSFKELVVNSVNHYFDEDIYDTMKEEYTPQDIKDEVKKRVRFSTAIDRND